MFENMPIVLVVMADDKPLEVKLKELESEGLYPIQELTDSNVIETISNSMKENKVPHNFLKAYYCIDGKKPFM